MATLWMSELATTDVASSDAFDSNQLMRQPASTHERTKSKSDRVWAGLRELRVLVVNDEQESGDALARLVRRWGHAARVAFDGLAALRVAAAQNPDVVLLDIEMPFIDWCQVARHLRLGFPRKDCLIIGVSRRADDEHRQKCIEAGIDLLLIKPVDPSVVEILLLLECERVNRSQIDNAACLAKKGSSQFVRTKPLADVRDSAAETSRSRLVAGTARGQQP